MLEILILLGAIFFVGAIIIGVLKLLFWVLLLPLKLGLWIVKGALALIFVIPAVILAVWAASSILPFVLSVIAIPILLVVFGALALLKAVF